MKKSFQRKMAALALALLVSISAVGCSLVSVNEEKDMAQVVAKVGDQEVLKSEVADLFDYYLSLYQQFGMDPTTSEEDLKLFQDDVLNAVLSGYVMDYQAKLQGLDTLTEDELAEAKTSAQADLDYVEEAIQSQIDTELETDPDLDVDARKAELFVLYTQAEDGSETGKQAFYQEMLDGYRKEAIRSKLQDTFNETITITDEDVQTYYDETLATQTETYTQTPASYRADEENYEKFGGDPVLYAPEGYRRVKHILLKPDTEIGAEYTDLETEMEELKDELGALTLEDETGNAQRIAEIKTEYAEKQAQRDKLYEDHFAQSKADAQAAYDKLVAGAEFDAVMEEYTKDTSFASYETIQEKGRLIGCDIEGDDTDWSDEIKAAVKGLTTAGSYTQIIEDDEGFHILQYVGDEAAGAKAFDEFKDALHEIVLTNKQTEEWNATLDAWLADTSVVTRYEDVIRSLGKTA